MKRMRSPAPNRRGEYEVHDVPNRRVESLRAKGWQEVGEASTDGTGAPITDVHNADKAGDPVLTATHRGGGYYRVTCGDEVVAESATKAEAREMGADV